jgi:lysophospholipid acyltransferase (LPLAT)-like uncharacterized protein
MNKEKKKYRRYGIILYFLLKLISKTLKIEVKRSSKIDLNNNYIYGFWHNKLIIASVCLDYYEKKAGLASPSNDGELIAVTLEKFGFQVVRGSSDQQPVRSILALAKLVKQGYSAGTPVDGPKGPIYKVKPGMLFLAQKSGKLMIPVGGAYSKCWTFEKSWDKFQFPKPFSKVVCIEGDPMEIPKGADLDEYALILEKEINRLDKEAEVQLRQGNSK